MPVPQHDTASSRRAQKPVLRSRLLHDMESTNGWSHQGAGQISFGSDHAQSGSQSLRLQSPTKRNNADRNLTQLRPDHAGASLTFTAQDWTAYNRISFWVYPDLPGFQVVSLLATLNTSPSTNTPSPTSSRDHSNFFLLKPGHWNHLLWEIPHLPRNAVTNLTFTYPLVGNETKATNYATLHLDQLELQQVSPDHFQGWNVAPGQIALSHSGYQLDTPKKALASDLPSKNFQLIQIDSSRKIPEKTVLTKDIEIVTTDLGRFQVLDFSEIRQPGLYLIQVGTLVTPPFPIGQHIWENSIWKTINFLYCQRCGIEIPEIHGDCHPDWRATHGQQTVPIHGGWHNGGEFSHHLASTAQTVHALFELAEKLPQHDTPLYHRLIEEAIWGLEWIHQTRFEDGSRILHASLTGWTDPGDALTQAGNDPSDIFLAAAAEAIAARVLGTAHSELANKSLQLAQQDWTLALQTSTNRTASTSDPASHHPSALDTFRPAALGLQATLELFKATSEQTYANHTYDLAGVIINAQQLPWTQWKVPLTGFFHTDTNRTQILPSHPQPHEQAAIAGLADLCRLFPSHIDWMQWYAAITLYSEFLQTTTKFNAPYHLPCASIYDTRNSQLPGSQAQAQNGIPLNDQIYLRRFPVWSGDRGHHSRLLSQTKALSTAALLRNNLPLARLAQEPLHWIVGRNPFAQSTLFGEGHNYAPHFNPVSGDVVGSLPAGFQTRADQDLPYWPDGLGDNSKQATLQPSSSWLSILSDLASPGTAIVTLKPDSIQALTFTEVTGATRFVVKPEKDQSTIQLSLPSGHYRLGHADQEASFALLPSSTHSLNLDVPIRLSVSSQQKKSGEVELKVKADGSGSHSLQVRVHNLRVDQPTRALDFSGFKSKTLSWTATVIATNQPWIALFIPDGNLSESREIYGPNIPKHP